MAKSTNPQFYKNRAWQNERRLYKQQHPFCERCLMLRIYKPTEIVHHREYLDEEKSKDAKIALNFDNLESLCFDCHNKEHHLGQQRSSKKRFFFNEQGLVIKDDENNSTDC